jgi:hypothetical protein
LLKLKTVAALFTPQFLPGTAALEGLKASSPIYASITGGAVLADGVNHGLGGLLITRAIPGVGIPKHTLAWAGATNPVWMANQETGLAALYGSQVLPPFEDKSVELTKAFFTYFGSGIAR